MNVGSQIALIVALCHNCCFESQIRGILSKERDIFNTTTMKTSLPDGQLLSYSNPVSVGSYSGGNLVVLFTLCCSIRGLVVDTRSCLWHSTCSAYKSSVDAVLNLYPVSVDLISLCFHQGVSTGRWTSASLMPPADWRSFRSTLKTWSWLMMLTWKRSVYPTPLSHQSVDTSEHMDLYTLTLLIAAVVLAHLQDISLCVSRWPMRLMDMWVQIWQLYARRQLCRPSERRWTLSTWKTRPLTLKSSTLLLSPWMTSGWEWQYSLAVVSCVNG